MSNQILTISMITYESVEIFKNSNSFIKNLDTQYSKEFAITGAKIGVNLRIRLPNSYTVSTGPGISIQDTVEQSVNLTCNNQSSVDPAFTSVDMTMSLDNFRNTILRPAMNTLAGNVASTVMAGQEGGVCNMVANFDQNGNVLSPTLDTILQARAYLQNNSAPTNKGRKVALAPNSMSRLAGSQAGLFNPQTAIADIYNNGEVYHASGFDWMEDQTVTRHVAGSYNGSATVSGSNQSNTTGLGMNLTVTALAGTLNAGDIITLGTAATSTAVNAVNRITFASTFTQRQFVVTANVLSGATSIPIYPGIVPGGSGYVPTTGAGGQQYQTTDISPANGASVNLFTVANAVFTKNIAWVPEAITLATADLGLPPNTMSARKVYDGISMRIIKDWYYPLTDSWINRCDVLYGFTYVRPEWAVSVLDIVS